MIKVRKNVPLPPRSYSKGPHNRFPLETMDVGDMFVMTPAMLLAHVTIHTYLGKRGNELGVKFTTRRLPEGLGVWRIR